MFLRKLRIPGGVILGSVLASLLLNVLTPYGYMPKMAKYLAQVLAGAYISCSVSVNDMRKIRKHLKPTAFLLTGHIILNLCLGTALYAVSSLDVVTSYSALIPGGLSEIPLIAEEMGGDPSMVLVIQFLRIVFGLALFPLVASRLRDTPRPGMDDIPVGLGQRTRSNLFLTCVIALLTAIAFKMIGVPAGVLVGAMVGTLILQLKFSKAWMPRPMRNFSQILAGSYIGCLISSENVEIMRKSFFLLAGSALFYILGCFLLAYLLFKCYYLEPRIACLAAMPAGANDVAMIASDFNISVGEIAFFQIARMLFSVICFPLLIHFLTGLGFPFF